MRMDILEIWLTELRELSQRAGVPTPAFRFVRKEDEPWYSFLRQGHNASASPRGITVTEDLMDASSAIRSYLLAHELAHIVHNHSKPTKRFGAAIILMCGALFLIMLFIHNPLLRVGSPLLVVLFAWYVGQMLNRMEYEADELAVGLIGKETAIEGCSQMAVASRTMNRIRRIRLEKMKQL